MLCLSEHEITPAGDADPCAANCSQRGMESSDFERIAVSKRAGVTIIRLGEWGQVTTANLGSLPPGLY